MRVFRLAFALSLIALTSVARAQLQTIEYPQPKFDLSKFYAEKDPFNARLAEMGKSAEKITTLWLILGAVGAAIIIGGAVLAFLAKSRATNDPLKIAMGDPWMRAQIEAMAPEEREQFFGQKQ